LVTAILESYVNFIAHLSECIIRDANAARLSDTFQPSGNVDAIAKNIAFLEYDIADMNANAKFDPTVRWHSLIAVAHPALNFRSTTRGIYGARKFD
jgi:hypothetical protein